MDGINYELLRNVPIKYHLLLLDIYNDMFRNNSYFKIRNLQMGYNVPVEFLKKFNMSQLRIYFSGENLLWFTPKNYVGNDPERIDISNIPVPTTYSFGLNVNF